MISPSYKKEQHSEARLAFRNLWPQIKVGGIFTFGGNKDQLRLGTQANENKIGPSGGRIATLINGNLIVKEMPLFKHHHSQVAWNEDFAIGS